MPTTSSTSKERARNGWRMLAAGRVVEFHLLQMELSIAEAVKVADMVVVHVGQRDVPDGIAVDADQGQRLDRAAEKPSLARRDLGGRSGVDDDGMMRRGRNPNEIVHRHRAVHADRRR